jgi:flagellar protein FliS
MYQQATRSYEQANYFTANPLRLVLMCYEGAISHLKLARESYLAKDYETKGKALIKTLEIIHELNATLDMKKGGEVAVNLRALYTYMVQSLVEADLKRNMAGFDHIIQMLVELEAGWREIASGNAGIVTSAPQAMLDNARNTVAASHSWNV